MNDQDRCPGCRVKQTYSLPSDLEQVNTLSPEPRISNRLVFQGRIMLQLNVLGNDSFQDKSHSFTSSEKDPDRLLVVAGVGEKHPRVSLSPHI